jgi:hypothetical protein
VVRKSRRAVPVSLYSVKVRFSYKNEYEICCVDYCFLFKIGLNTDLLRFSPRLNDIMLNAEAEFSGEFGD